MRHVAEHEYTDKMLKSWAGDSRLAKAALYFWTSGSEKQRSQAGLLRYMLHKLLSYNLDLWQKLLAMTTRERIESGVEWSATELMGYFHRYLKHTLPSTKLSLH